MNLLLTINGQELHLFFIHDNLIFSIFFILPFGCLSSGIAL